MSAQRYLAALRKQPQTARQLAVTLGLPTSRDGVARVRRELERMERAGLAQRTLAAGFHGPWVWEAVPMLP